MENNEIVIDLRRGEQSARYDVNELFQLAAYRRVCRLLDSTIDRYNFLHRTYDREAMAKISDFRSHNAIFVGGGRGSGKTSFILNIDSYIRHRSRDDAPAASRLKEWFLFIDPIDPTLLEDSDNFLSVILGQINRGLAEVLNRNQRDSCEYYAVLEKVASALQHTQTSGKHYGLDRLLSYQSSLDLEESLHEFFQVAAALAGKRAIVLLIDDVDMALSNGFEILDIIRKYLSSPFLVPIITGDLSLYRKLVFGHFYGELMRGELPDGKMKEQEVTAEGLTSQYLRKIFPPQNRVSLAPVIDIVEGGPDRIDPPAIYLVTGIPGEKRLLLKNIRLLFKHLLDLGLNAEKESYRKFYPETARELIQFLKNCEDPIKDLHAIRIPGADSLFEPSAREAEIRDFAKAVSIHDEMDENRVYIQFLRRFKYYWLNRDDGILHLMTETSYAIAAPFARREKRSLIRELPFFNPLLQRSLCDALPREKVHHLLAENAKILGDSRNRAIDGGQARRFIPADLTAIQPYPPFDPLDTTLRISVKNFEVAQEKILSHLFVRLFTHRDFASSHEVRALVFFGKFFEMVVGSIIQDLDAEMLLDILNALPFHSVLSVKPAEDISIEEQGDGQEAPESARVPGSVHKIRVKYDESLLNYIQKLSEKLMRWRTENNLLPAVSAHLLHHVMLYYFSQLNTFKRRRSGTEQELLSTIAQRAKYVLWNAFAVCEKELLDGKVSGGAHRDIAIDEPGSLKRLARDRSYQQNIEPLVAEGECSAKPGDLPEGRRCTVTAALASHPLFRYVDYLLNATDVTEAIPPIPVRARDTRGLADRHGILSKARDCKSLNGVINVVFGTKVAASRKRLKEKFPIKRSYLNRLEQFAWVVPRLSERLKKALLPKMIAYWKLPSSYYGGLYSLASSFECNDVLDGLVREQLQAFSGKHPYRGYDLTGMPLAGIDLKNAILEKAGMEGVDLKKAKLRNANLSGADLTKAELREADLSEADLSEAKLAGADLRDANLAEANLVRGDLEGAVLRGAGLSKANLSGAVLRGARLRGAILRGSDLGKADLRQADMESADLEGATLRDARLDKIQLRGALLRDADLRGAVLKGADLRGADLTGAKLGGATLEGVRLERTTLENADLRGAVLGVVDLSEERARSGPFLAAEISTTESDEGEPVTTLAEANFPRANFSGAKLTIVLSKRKGK